MNNPEAKHHRINEQLKDYWDGLRGNRPMPLESEVVLEDLKDIWDYCFLMSVRGNNFAYDFLGEQLVEAYGDDLTGKEITETLLYPHPISLFNSFREVVKTGQVGMDENEFTNSRGVLVKYRSCVLPLAAAGNPSVAFLLGGMKWKAI